MIRKLEQSDIPEIVRIHGMHYNQLECPDFFKNFLGAFIITDDENETITVGGVRVIPEVVLLTDMSKSTRARRSALYQVLDASGYIAGNSGFDRLYAAVKDTNWSGHLKDIGFKSRGEFLVLEL